MKEKHCKIPFVKYWGLSHDLVVETDHASNVSNDH